MDEIRTLDTFLDVGDDIDREVGFEHLLECILLEFTLDLHAALVSFALRVLDGALHLLDLLVLGAEFFLGFETLLFYLK